MAIDFRHPIHYDQLPALVLAAPTPALFLIVVLSLVGLLKIPVHQLLTSLSDYRNRKEGCANLSIELFPMQ